MTSSNNLTKNSTQSGASFRRLALLTASVIYLLILVGGIVRSTGSGMGCPDWPKCFGQWVPPTDVSQLPENYQEIYAHRGYADVTFNPAKTWTEYINRLLGVLTGFFIFFTFLASLPYRRHDVVVTVLSFLAFILVGVQGWLGARVVASVLTPWIITLHMLLALVIVGLLLYVVARTYAQVIPAVILQNKVKINSILIISILLLLLQILLGTQVRETIDEVSKQLGSGLRNQWVENLGAAFYIHRSFSLVVLGVQLWWVMLVRKNEKAGITASLANWSVGLIVIEILTGITMAYFAIPSWAQPIHLTLATLALGIQFVVLLLINKEKLLASQRQAELAAIG